MIYDIVIIGGGPAGLTAAIYGRRQNKTVMVIEKNTFGGQTVYSPKIENIPGFNEMSGMDFADRLFEQASYQGAEFAVEEALEIIENGETKTVKTDYSEYECRAIIIAAGAKHRLLGLDGEENY
ncbi:MAG: NAD(P)/FAD-dependent oxidoreductase, partial [Firmicutes bacterium]|nr:NAD(P)/FAD-dependent oxidoreductase [Candidatus Colimorpha enterica]